MTVTRDELSIISLLSRVLVKYVLVKSLFVNSERKTLPLDVLPQIFLGMLH